MSDKSERDRKRGRHDKQRKLKTCSRCNTSHIVAPTDTKCPRCGDSTLRENQQ